jgi:hypothetical protein
LAREYAQVAAQLQLHEDRDGAVTLPESRHETYKDLSDKLILWLRCHKLKPENESFKSSPPSSGG